MRMLPAVASRVVAFSKNAAYTRLTSGKSTFSRKFRSVPRIMAPLLMASADRVKSQKPVWRVVASMRTCPLVSMPAPPCIYTPKLLVLLAARPWALSTTSSWPVPVPVILTPLLNQMPLFASSVSVALVPVVLAMLAATVMLPSCPPLPVPVVMVTLVPSFRLFWMSVLRMIEVFAAAVYA